MGLLQKAVETYDAHIQSVGVEVEGHQILVPVAHVLTRADLEITLDQEGRFVSARAVDVSEPKIPIPATEKSAGRTSGEEAHPLCDQLKYLCDCNESKYKKYVEQLTKWCESEYSHPMLKPILNYVNNKSILSDLSGLGLIALDEEKRLMESDSKMLVRWRVHGIGTPNDGCWQQPELFQAFQNWYMSMQSAGNVKLCMITGENTAVADQHPKGIIPIKGNAKLISANDKSGFTFRGRFTDESQALTIGYLATQKAHNALRWIAAEQGVILGERAFLCWSPQGTKICHATGPFGNPEQVIQKPSDYQEELKKTLQGYLSQLPEKNSSVVIAALDAATTGRLSITYYNELMGSDYLNRLHLWDRFCCWYGWNGRIQSPSLYTIVHCAFGKQITEKGKTKMKADAKVLGQQIQRLISCRVDGNRIPTDMMMVLFHRASSPQSYEESVWKTILSTACAVIRKYRYDYYKEECSMELNTENPDRSYQFGRLLAVFEKAERDTYSSKETREPYAIRMMSVFTRRPLYAANQIEQQLERAYFSRLSPASRTYYKKLIGEILQQIYQNPQTQWNASLNENYLMGYYLQRNELYRSKKENRNDNGEEERV